MSRGILGVAMARPVRIEYSGAVYHVTSRGNEKKPLFLGDEDREVFVEFLGNTAQRFGWSVTAWVLMTNHFHLIIQTPEPNLSAGMHWLNGGYASWFNRRHKRWGHLFGQRFDAKLIQKETYFRNALCYTVLNPVRAKMVERPEDYRWSSYHSTAGLSLAPGWFDVEGALEMFAPDRELAQEYYRASVAERIGSTECLWDQLINGIYLGTEEWAKSVRRVLVSKRRSREHPRMQRAVGRPKIGEVLHAVASVTGTGVAQLKASRGGPLRRLIAWIGWNESLMRLREIAKVLGLRSLGHVSNEIRRSQREFEDDPRILDLVQRVFLALQH